MLTSEAMYVLVYTAYDRQESRLNNSHRHPKKKNLKAGWNFRVQKSKRSYSERVRLNCKATGQVHRLAVGHIGRPRRAKLLTESTDWLIEFFMHSCNKPMQRSEPQRTYTYITHSPFSCAMSTYSRSCHPIPSYWSHRSCRNRIERKLRMYHRVYGSNLPKYHHPC